MAYNIEDATFQDYREGNDRDLAGHAYVKFNDIGMSAEEFYISTIANENGNNTQYLGKCGSIEELEKLADGWAND